MRNSTVSFRASNSTSLCAENIAAPSMSKTSRVVSKRTFAQKNTESAPSPPQEKPRVALPSTRPCYANVESSVETPRTPAPTSRSNHYQNQCSGTPREVVRPPSRINDGHGAEIVLCGGGSREPPRGLRTTIAHDSQPRKRPIRSFADGCTTASYDE